MKEPRFGQALPDHLREPQRFASCDPHPHLPLIGDGERLPTRSEAALYAGSVIVFLAFVAWL